MDGILVFVIYSLVMFVVSLAGAYVPQIRDLTDKQTHMLIGVSAGIFLGLLFITLLPEAFHMSVEQGYGFNDVSYLVLAGFLVLAFVNCLIKFLHMESCPCECHDDEHSHEIYSLSAFIGLSVHAACDGLALAAALLGGQDVGFIALVGMCIHKFVVLFSLSSSLLLSDSSKKSRWVYLTAFSLITPIAGIVFYLFLTGFDIGNVAGLPMAFAAGSFMYVTFCNMLPEAFHRKDNEMRSFLLVLLGVAIAAAMFLCVNAMGAHIHMH